MHVTIDHCNSRQALSIRRYHCSLYTRSVRRIVTETTLSFCFRYTYICMCCAHNIYSDNDEFDRRYFERKKNVSCWKITVIFVVVSEIRQPTGDVKSLIYVQDVLFKSLMNCWIIFSFLLFLLLQILSLINYCLFSSQNTSE